MNSLVGKNRLLMVLTVFTIIVIIEKVLYILSGYSSPGGVLLILSIFALTGIHYAFALICMVIVIWLIFKRQPNFFFTLSWLLVVILGQIPKGHFFTAGALFSLYKAGPANVISDAANLANEFPPYTCIGFRERFPCDNPISYDKLPSSIKELYPAHVLILEDYLLIEKAGLQGVFKGFVLFRESSDRWENEKSITLQSGCNYCWKIRIIDGLYWYYETPDFPIEFP